MLDQFQYSFSYVLLLYQSFMVGSKYIDNFNETHVYFYDNLC